MDKRGWNIWNELTFKTQGYRKNFDLVTENENLITEHSGTISLLRITESKPPLIIGEYGFSVWNISLAKMLNVNLNNLIKSYKSENTYDEIMVLINNKEFDVNKYNRIIFIHGLVIHPDYRKLGITEEFIEFMYRDFYADNVAIIGLFKPIQNNLIDSDYYFKRHLVKVRNKMGSPEHELIPATEYYSLNQLVEKTDTEMNEYKLFAVAKKCGFNRIDGSHLLLFNSEIIIERIKEKYIKSNEITKEII